MKSARRAWEVWGLHGEAKRAEAVERRARSLEEVKKRKAYRVAHGLEKAEEGLQLGEGSLGAMVGAGAGAVVGDEGRLDDQAGKPPPPKRPVKKWLGIWE